MKEVAKNYVTLQYYSPEDDGGSPITCYHVEKREDRSSFWTIAATSPEQICQITGLIEGTPYKFRVAAENKQGTGLFTEYITSVTPKSPYDFPDAPTVPKIVTTTPSSVSISWEPPLTDGGTPVLGYLIEVRDTVSGRWRALNSTPLDTTKFTANNLMEDSLVEFRVAAVNEVGQGKFSKPSSTAVVRDPIGANLFNISSNQSVSIIFQIPKSDVSYHSLLTCFGTFSRNFEICFFLEFLERNLILKHPKRF